MSGSELRLSDLKRHLKPIVDELLDSVTNKPEDVEYLIDYALKELLYPKKRTAKDRIYTTDDRPCDTEPSDNLIKVDFSPDK
jgi:hypothetical protein|tara:strand:- start:245 stop:490 length:246 start_codon:yes stop_codon:yes gene_type:complete